MTSKTVRWWIGAGLLFGSAFFGCVLLGDIGLFMMGLEFTISHQTAKLGYQIPITVFVFVANLQFLIGYLTCHFFGFTMQTKRDDA